MRFDASGKFVGIEGNGSIIEFKNSPEKTNGETLKTSEELEFLKEIKKVDNVFDNPYWSLYDSEKELKPLTFSNEKTQEDIVKEIVGHIKDGRKIVLLKGACGTGKSAIALNIARNLGKSCIIVPIKSLQRQYEKDYTNKKYLLKKNGTRMKIAVITGRDNHDSIIYPGVSCADPYLPDTIKLTEKNYEKIKEYYLENPLISNKALPNIKNLRRMSIAPANPYWSPIFNSDIELNQIKDAKKYKYEGIGGKQFTFYHRKNGCSYYDQYLAYTEADVIIFNSAKYLAEMALERKPMSEVDIIDEADDFLDSLTNSFELNLTRLSASLKNLYPEKESAIKAKEKIVNLVDLEETNKKALGIDENKIHKIEETKVIEIFKILLDSLELQSEILIDETNYANSVLEAVENFKESFKDTYLTYKKEEDNLYVNIVNTDLAKKFNEIVEKNKAVILMSGTLHSASVMKNIFGAKDFATVEAETLNQGNIEIVRTGKEFDCRYSNFQNGTNNREDYLHALSYVIERSVKPTLVHVNAFSDLPTREETEKFDVGNLKTKEELIKEQYDDRDGRKIQMFRDGLVNSLFTTKCSRGVDFPGKMCNSVVFTKFPNPNVRDIFWRILEKTKPEYYWDFYKDKAWREFLQRIYRAVRFKEDHVYVMSPDLRILKAVRELQEKS